MRISSSNWLVIASVAVLAGAIAAGVAFWTSPLEEARRWLSAWQPAVHAPADAELAAGTAGLRRGTSFTGQVDRADWSVAGFRIDGWVAVPAEPTRMMMIGVFQGGRLLAVTERTIARPDVVADRKLGGSADDALGFLVEGGTACAGTGPVVAVAFGGGEFDILPLGPEVTGCAGRGDGE